MAAAARLPRPRLRPRPGVRGVRRGRPAAGLGGPVSRHARAQAGPVGVPRVLHLLVGFQHPAHYKNVESICEAYGRPVGTGSGRRNAFPTPRELSRAGEAPLRALGLGYRAAYVAETASAVVDSAVDLMSLREEPYEQALETLTGLPGVGDKVANCVLLFALDKPEAFPVDVWIDRALREWYLGDDDSISRPKMRPWAQRRFGAIRRLRQPLPVPRQAPTGQELIGRSPARLRLAARPARPPSPPWHSCGASTPPNEGLRRLHATDVGYVEIRGVFTGCQRTAQQCTGRAGVSVRRCKPYPPSIASKATGWNVSGIRNAGPVRSNTPGPA